MNSKYNKMKERHPLRRDIILVIVLLLLILVAIIFLRFKELGEPVQKTEIIYIEPEVKIPPVGRAPDPNIVGSLLQPMHDKPVPPELIPDSLDFEWPLLDTFDTLLNKAMEEISPKPPSHFSDSVYSFIIINLPNFDLEDIYPANSINVWDELKPIQTSDKTPLGIVDYPPPTPIGGVKAIENNMVYPPIKDWSNIQDHVILQVFIDSGGIATQVLTMKTCGNDTLDKAAQNAIKKTFFKPAIGDDEPIGVWIAIPVTLKLN